MDKFTVDEVNSPKRYINSTAVRQVDKCIDKVFEYVNGSSGRTKMQQLKKGNTTTQAEVEKFYLQINVKVNLHSIRFSYVFVRFFTFLLLLDKVCAFSSAFLCVHIRTNQTVHIMDKIFLKKIFCKGVQLYFEISLLSFTHKIFEQNFYLYITVYLVRMWTYKNADEKAHTFSRRSKDVKKRTKTNEKRILCKFTLRQVFPLASVKRFTVHVSIVAVSAQRNCKLQKLNRTKHVNINFSQCYLGCYFTRLIAVSKLKL